MLAIQSPFLFFEKQFDNIENLPVNLKVADLLHIRIAYEFISQEFESDSIHIKHENYKIENEQKTSRNEAFLRQTSPNYNLI